MKITMKEAILQGKDFEWHGNKCINKGNGIYTKKVVDGNRWYIHKILENQDKLVEVEDKYWDSEGRAIREPNGKVYFYIDSDGNISSASYFSENTTHPKSFAIGNCFKDETSAQAHLDKLKQEQSERMAKINQPKGE